MFSWPEDEKSGWVQHETASRVAHTKAEDVEKLRSGCLKGWSSWL